MSTEHEVTRISRGRAPAARRPERATNRLALYWSMLTGRDAVVSVNLLDAVVRALAVATVLVLALLGYGHPEAASLRGRVDPVLVALALVAYNLFVLAVLGVPWRRAPGFGLFVVDWAVVSLAVFVTRGFFSPFLILYYALIIGAALRLGLPRSLLLIGGCAVVYGALSVTQPGPLDPSRFPILAVGLSSLLMVGVTAVALRHSVEVEVRRSELEEKTSSQLRIVNNLSRVVLSGSPDLERVMRTVAAASSRSLQADSGLAVLFGAAPIEHEPQVDAGLRQRVLIVADDEPNPARLSPVEEEMAEEAARTQLPVCVDDVSAERLLVEARFPGLERDGSRPRAIACVPFLLNGEVIGVLFVGRILHRPFSVRDISLLSAIGQQMAVAVRLARLYDLERRRAARSEERERVERDLLSVVSHELRTPLTSIKTSVGALASLEHSGVSEGQASAEKRLLLNVERSTDKLILMVNELLDMARLRAGRVSLNLQVVNLGELVNEAAAHMKPLLDTRQQTLVVDLPPQDSKRWGELAAIADRRRIEQVIVNFLSNANKYAPAGSRISVGATPKHGHVRVFVRDDGPGIPQGDQARIFDKFYQGAAGGPVEGRPEGAGLGLAIARSLVELHGGQIGVQSRPGRGSTFYVMLRSAQTDARGEAVVVPGRGTETLH
jgi:signal transduction histidine kinase